jgi:hypothetical protein
VYIFLNYHEPRIQSSSNQCPTKYHIHTGFPKPTEIKQNVTGVITDVRGKLNVKSTASFIKLCRLNAYIFNSKLSWLSSKRTPNLLRNSNVTRGDSVNTRDAGRCQLKTVHVTATVGCKSSRDRNVARILIAGDSGSIPVSPCAIYGG